MYNFAIMTSDYLILLTIALLAITIGIFAFWVDQIDKRIKNILGGKSKEDLAQAMSSVLREVKEIRDLENEIKTHLVSVEKRLRRSIQHVRTVRFNPFAGQGGNQSFAVALLNEEKDGVVISSLYTREKSAVYAKPILNNNSEFELTKEEKEAVGKS